MSPTLDLRLGVDEHHRSAAAALYYDAFSQLLAPILGAPAQALPLLARSLDLERAVAAVELCVSPTPHQRRAAADDEAKRGSVDPCVDSIAHGNDRAADEDSDAHGHEHERLVGICGLHFDGRHFVALRPGAMLRAFGLVDGLRRIFVGGLLDHQPRPGELVIDGIAVLPAARGRGVGSLLLGELERFARAEGLRALSLDVAADNRRAGELYRRCGFVERGSSSSWLVRRVYGITAVQSMSKRLA